MTLHVSEDQMAVIGLIRETVCKLSKYDEDRLTECKDSGAVREFYTGRVMAWRTVIDFLDDFDVPEVDE